MLWIIIRKEFLECLRSPRFVIGFSVTLVLVMLTTIINLKDFKERRKDYSSAVEEMNGDQVFIRIYRPPELLSVLAEGKDRNLGNRLDMSYVHLPEKLSGYTGNESQHQRFVAGFFSIDYAFVVRFILSLLVIFLTYDAISGEKSRGTLRWVHSNPVPRYIFLAGKCFGSWCVIFIALLTATIAALFILMLDHDVSLGRSEWIRISSMFGVSVLYLTCFFTLGLLISVITNRPSISLAVLLQAWIFLSIIYPNVAVIFAQTFYKLPTGAVIEQKRAAAVRSFEQAYKKSLGDIGAAMHSGEGTSDKDITNFFDVQARRTAAYHQVDVEYGNALTNQVECGRMLSLLSPPALYDQAMAAFAKTDLREYETFMNAVYLYWQQSVELYKFRRQHPEMRKTLKLPAFGFTPEPYAASFMGTLPQVLILFLLGSIFFVFAHLKFLRKDLR